jgi:hypothetical protein
MVYYEVFIVKSSSRNDTPHADVKFALHLVSYLGSMYFSSGWDIKKQDFATNV